MCGNLSTRMNTHFSYANFIEQKNGKSPKQCADDNGCDNAKYWLYYIAQSYLLPPEYSYVYNKIKLFS